MANCHNSMLLPLLLLPLLSICAVNALRKANEKNLEHWNKAEKSGKMLFLNHVEREQLLKDEEDTAKEFQESHQKAKTNMDVCQDAIHAVLWEISVQLAQPSAWQKIAKEKQIGKLKANREEIANIKGKAQKLAHPHASFSECLGVFKEVRELENKFKGIAKPKVEVANLEQMKKIAKENYDTLELHIESEEGSDSEESVYSDDEFVSAE